MTSPLPHENNDSRYGSAFRSDTAASAFGSTSTRSDLAALDGRLTWLDLNTRPPAVNSALNRLFVMAMQDNRDAQRAGRFLLSLWSPDQHPLDLNDLSLFECELNFACRHLMNFIVACQVNFRSLVTHSQMAPVIAAWGDRSA